MSLRRGPAPSTGPRRREWRHYPQPSERPAPLRTVTHRLPARRRGALGLVQLAPRPPGGRRDDPAHRGHRRRAQPPRAHRQHPRDAPLARARLGWRARPPVRSDRSLHRCRRPADRERARRTTATARPSRSRPGPGSAVAPRVTTGSAASDGSRPDRDGRCGSALPTRARLRSTIWCGVESSSRTPTSRTSCCCAPAACPPSCSPTSSTMPIRPSPMSCGARSTSAAHRSTSSC